jgi:hypothetical protein
LEVIDFGNDIRVDFELGQVDDFTTATACAEFERLRFVGKVRAKRFIHGDGHLEGFSSSSFFVLFRTAGYGSRKMNFNLGAVTVRMIVIPPGGANPIGQFIPFQPLGRKIGNRWLSHANPSMKKIGFCSGR